MSGEQANLNEQKAVNGSEGLHDLSEPMNLVRGLHKELKHAFRELSDEPIVVFRLDDRDSERMSQTIAERLCPECYGQEPPRGFWRNRVQDFVNDPRSRWHRCPARRWCALIPVTVDNRCLAACRFSMDAGTQKDKFLRTLRMLELLVENYLLRQLGGASDADKTQKMHKLLTARERKETYHPKVQQTLEYIEDHLSSPYLNVTHIATILNINSTYLAHLFADQVGERMSRYIAFLRVELAKQYLAETKWPINKVSKDIGFRSPDWFSQVFRNYTGMTPRDYRRREKDD